MWMVKKMMNKPFPGRSVRVYNQAKGIAQANMMTVDPNPNAAVLRTTFMKSGPASISRKLSRVKIPASNNMLERKALKASTLTSTRIKNSANPVMRTTPMTIGS